MTPATATGDTGKIESIRRKLSVSISQPVVKVIAKSGITPDMLTWFGFILSLVAAGLVGWGLWLWAGITVLLAGLFDMLDGALARYKGKTSKFGAVLDSTLDRASEGVLLIALAFSLASQGSVAGVTLVSIVMLFSFLVSYIRSKAEAININCKEGIFTRSERVIVIALGLIFSQVMVALGIIAVFSIITTVHRLVLVWSKARA